MSGIVRTFVETVRNVSSYTIDQNIATTSSPSFAGLNVSGNVGIGTTSPAAKLDVNGNVNISTSGNLFLSNTSGIFFNGNNSFATGIYNDASGILRFATNGSDRMRLDTSGNLGLGVVPSAWGSSWGKALQVNRFSLAGDVNNGGYLFANAYLDGSTVRYMQGGYATAYMTYNGQHQWHTAPSGTAGNAISFTQAMTLDASGNLLIGATSGNAKVKIGCTSSNISGGVVNVGSFGSNGVISLGGAKNNNEGIYIGTGDTAGTGIASGIGFLREESGWNSALTFYTNKITMGGDGVSAIQEKMRIDSSGNLGLGVVPSAWTTNTKAFEGPSGGSISFYNQGNFPATWISSNAYYNGSNWIAKVSDQSCLYSQEGTTGRHMWYTVSADTAAGSAISFTQAMTLDASTNLILSDGVLGSAYGGYIRAKGVAGMGGYLTLGSYDNGVFNEAIMVTQQATAIVFKINSGSNGTTAERMRLDASGNLLVGRTSQSDNGKLEVAGYTQNVAAFVNNQSSSGYNGIYTAIQATGNNTSTYHFKGQTYSTNAWYLYGNGTSSYSSDERLKKNIETARDGYLEDLMKLRVVKYNWKNSDEGTPRELGIIAQEIEKVFPGLVQDDLAPLSEDDPTLYKQVKWSVLPFILTKAIQEQQAIFTATIQEQQQIIEELKSRIEKLEAV